MGTQEVAMTNSKLMQEILHTLSDYWMQIVASGSNMTGTQRHEAGDSIDHVS
jgi:hypothetical protein